MQFTSESEIKTQALLRRNAFWILNIELHLVSDPEQEGRASFLRFVRVLML